MSPLQLLLILRAHYKVALAVAISTIVIALAVMLLLPKKYSATTAVIVDVKSPDPVTALLMPASQQTQVDIITSDRVSTRVVRNLGLIEGPGVRAQWETATEGKGTPEAWLAALLLRGLVVSPARDSNIITIAYTGADPAFAAAVANGFAQAYIDIAIELKVEPARQYARWFNEQGKTLRENLEKAQAKLSEFQQEKGIVAKEEQLDTENTKLTNLTLELIKVQAEINVARSKQQSGSAGDLLPEVAANPVVATLRSEVLKQEAKLQETALNLGNNHPQYLRMQSEVAALKQKLDSETHRVTSGFSASRSVGTESEGALRAAVEAQKRRILELRGGRDQLAVLQRDVDAARAAYDSVSKRYTESDLASQSTQTNVSVLNPALVPLEPSFPKPLGKTMLIAVALGVFFGVAAAFLLEMLDRRVRTSLDLVEGLQLPVLGLIARARPPGRLLAFWRRRMALMAG